MEKVLNWEIETPPLCLSFSPSRLKVLRGDNLEKVVVTNFIKVLNFALRYMLNIGVGPSIFHPFSQSGMFPIQQLPNFRR